MSKYGRGICDICSSPRGVSKREGLFLEVNFESGDKVYFSKGSRSKGGCGSSLESDVLSEGLDAVSQCWIDAGALA